MNVKSILSSKGTGVLSIEPTATLAAAVNTLTQHKIGALVVLGPDRRVIGILSERDIVRALAEHRRLLRAAFAAKGGVEVDTQGDGSCTRSPTRRRRFPQPPTGRARWPPGR